MKKEEKKDKKRKKKEEEKRGEGRKKGRRKKKERNKRKKEKKGKNERERKRIRILLFSIADAYNILQLSVALDSTIHRPVGDGTAQACGTSSSRTGPRTSTPRFCFLCHTHHLLFLLLCKETRW
jgi:uncharacterized Rmd1/YagE family protein